MKLVIAGVSGSGKSTVGKCLADLLSADFLDADSFHPPANIEKMSAGIPLNDEDRASWIETLGKELATHDRVVLACSALKKIYRDRLREFESETKFAMLVLDKDELDDRLAARANTGHFMPATLVGSQLAILERGPDVTEFENRSAPVKVAEKIISEFDLR